MENHMDIIKREFTKQSGAFNEYQNVSSKEKCTDQILEELELSGQEQVLEVAAGTCALGRKIAPQVKHIVELDAVDAMLSKGKEENEKTGIDNASYVLGVAESLPFLDSSYDVVISRLAFHHFVDPRTVMEEMARVLKENGKLVILDMVAKDEAFREKADYYEKLRDPSHVKKLTEKEFVQLLNDCGLKVEYQENVVIPMNLENWMNLTAPAIEIREEITAAMRAELAGCARTGFEPYEEEGSVKFNHNWTLMIAGKKEIAKE